MWEDEAAVAAAAAAAAATTAVVASLSTIEGVEVLLAADMSSSSMIVTSPS